MNISEANATMKLLRVLENPEDANLADISVALYFLDQRATKALGVNPRTPTQIAKITVALAEIGGVA